MSADIIVPAASGVGGVVTSGWMVRYLLQRWMEKNDKNHDESAKAIQRMEIQLTRIEERVSSLQRTEERTHKHASDIAVLTARVADAEEDINGLGKKVREIGDA